jgi:hypothetical protein
MEHIVNVSLATDHRGIDSGVTNPLTDVARGDTVIWRFPTGQNLRVVVPHASLFDATLLHCEEQPNQISRRVSETAPGAAKFEYHIEDDQGRLKFDNGSTGVIEMRDPPNR